MPGGGGGCLSFGGQRFCPLLSFPAVNIQVSEKQLKVYSTSTPKNCGELKRSRASQQTRDNKPMLV